MQAEQLNELKAAWLDQLVEVKDGVPDLARFAGKRGQVKSVNWNGQCLVEWDGPVDTGWYDISPSALKIVASN